MPLKIELKPHESVIIGEALITNDAERIRFYIEGNVPIVREKFIIREKDANTPSKRVYFIVQQMYLTKEIGRASCRERVLRLVLMQVLSVSMITKQNN